LLLVKKFQETETEYKRKDERYVLDLILSDGSVHPYKGKIDFMDREIGRC